MEFFFGLGNAGFAFYVTLYKSIARMKAIL
jgi:hypothetical protein